MGTVLAGNQRLRIHKERGDKEVEVSVPERELTEEEIKKIGIISNRHSGEWDMDKLANEFEDVLAELGFDDLLPEVELEVKEDDYEEPEDLETTVVLGDVYQLGEHRLMCGDSTKIEDVEKLMDGQKADMVFTDPPYGVGYDGGAKKRKLLANDNIGTDIYGDSLPFTNMFTTDKASLYLWYADANVAAAAAAAAAAGWDITAQIIWVKNNAQFVSSAHYHGKHEPCFYAHKKGKSCAWYGGKNKVTVWDVDRSNKNEYHPTQKPVQLAVNAVSNSSIKDNIVLDLFGGSGSTLIACEQTNRKCYMMEIDPHYCQVIIDRWEKFTGNKAIKLE